ncbi:hypothetical protein C2G38_2185735 [Gigaspora rosea]|uniref:Uncharacterized protein n=1 Tax=Gigaspora rosea TaxID=44941 RepID=A0A397V6E0_9GLOM|nr:hypothetical protein C2G38_2185735 [Gigaspora rosea]
MYYLHIPIPLSMRNKKKGGMISLDPGIRSFVTGYDPGGNVVEFCKSDFSRFSRLCVHHDKYQSQLTEVNLRKQSLADLNKSLKINPNNADALRSRGVTFYLVKRYKESLTDLTKSLEINPNNAFTLANCEETYRMMKIH